MFGASFNPTKLFHVQVDVHETTLSGVLAQEHGGVLRPIAYYSRKKSPVEQGFDPCTQHVLAVHWILTTTEPLVGFQSVVVHTMHTPVRMLLQGQIKAISAHRLARWLTDIQARNITTEHNRILPHLLGDVEGEPHVCEPRPEIQSPVGDCELPGQTRAYIDGSRFWEEGRFHTGCAVWVPQGDSDSGQKLLFKLPPGMSAQEAELTALLEALKAHPEPLCVFTDSRYVFGVTHDFLVQWQVRKFLTAAGAPIKHFNTITAIWHAIQARETPLSVVKVRAHIRKDPDVHERHNNMADRLAKMAATCGEIQTQNNTTGAAVSAIKATPIDLKEYQQDLWEEGGLTYSRIL